MISGPNLILGRTPPHGFRGSLRHMMQRETSWGWDLRAKSMTNPSRYRRSVRQLSQGQENIENIYKEPGINATTRNHTTPQPLRTGTGTAWEIWHGSITTTLRQATISYESDHITIRICYGIIGPPPSSCQIRPLLRRLSPRLLTPRALLV